MGELLHLKCNAAIPVVDVGTDVFAFQDDREEVARIQVKTASGKLHKNGKDYHAVFRLPIDQLKRTDSPPLFYALAVRLGNRWGQFIVISRTNLESLRNDGCGSQNETGDFDLYVQFRQNDTEGEPQQEGGEQRTGTARNVWKVRPYELHQRMEQPPAAQDARSH